MAMPLEGQVAFMTGAGSGLGVAYRRGEVLTLTGGFCMPTIFTRIIDGELPGRFVWRDDICVGFLSIAPIRTGHTLVVPIAEVDHWLDLDPDTIAHLMRVSQTIGQAQMAAFSGSRVGLIIAGLEVPHTHLHVLPIDSEADLRFDRADPNTPGDALDAAADKLRAALRDRGHGIP